MNRLARYLPILTWGRRYDRDTATADLVAAAIVTIMLIPQSLAYAMLAGLPPEMGLYASVLPIVAYALFGTSSALAVGPVAVASLMTATAAGAVAAPGTPDYLAAAVILALLSGIFLTTMGLLRLGFVANFLSHPVIAGFMTASGILIAASQVKHILGVRGEGDTLLDIIAALRAQIGETSLWTLVIGAGAIGFLYWVRSGLKPLLVRRGLSDKPAGILAKTGPVMAVVASTVFVWLLGLDKAGVPVVGSIPRGLPPFAAPGFDAELWGQLFGSAVLISVIGFVESVSVAQTFAAKRRQRIDPDQELIGIGAANFASAFSGGYPVTGGFSRSAVNFDAGAETPAAGAFTAVGIGFAILFLTPLLQYLPKATLAATIIVAVLTLVDFRILGRAWTYSRADFAAVLATIVATLGWGVEAGVTAGVALSVALYLYKTSRPHIAEVGQVPGTEHFRNILRHQVLTEPHVLTIRIDESLYFANARFLEDYIQARVVPDCGIEHVVLMCSAINDIDLSALDSLEAINRRLADMGITLNLSEVKGPVMDRLLRSHFIEEMTGHVYLSQYAAMAELSAKRRHAA